MAIAAGKGAKAQKIGLKEQASPWSSAYPIARRSRLRWELPPSATQGVRGRLPQASRTFLPPVPVPSPLGRGAGRRRPKLYDAARFGRAS
jgi:hypothetical protein